MKDYSKLESYIIETMREAKTPGLSIAIVADDRMAYSKGFGFRDIASGLPVTPRTLFGIGSVTKSFTALAMMQLVEKGKVSLADPVENYLPLTIRPFDEQIRIEHLLTHSSGLPALGYAEAFINGMLGADSEWLPISNVDDVVNFMKDSKEWAVSKPGARHFYLNEGWAILGSIISRVTGMRYDEYVKRNILEPLCMDRTLFSKIDVDQDGDVATPYIIDRDGKHLPSVFPYGISADGGWISNVVDLSNYLLMFLGRGEFEGKVILGKKSLSSMEEAHIGLPYEMLGKVYYGYGLRISSLGNHKLVGHTGSVGVYTAYLGYLPDAKVGVAVLANPSEYNPSHLGMFALAELAGMDSATLPFIKNHRILRKLQGRYETYKGTMKIDVRKKGDFLFYESRDRYTEQTLPLVPDELNDEHARFYTLVDGVKHPFDFVADENGNIELIYERYKFKRTATYS